MKISYLLHNLDVASKLYFYYLKEKQAKLYPFDSQILDYCRDE